MIGAGPFDRLCCIINHRATEHTEIFEKTENDYTHKQVQERQVEALSESIVLYFMTVLVMSFNKRAFYEPFSLSQPSQ